MTILNNFLRKSCLICRNWSKLKKLGVEEMMKEFRQSISLTETLVFCLLSGAFIYFVTWIPRLRFDMFPPTQSGDVQVSFYVSPGLNLYFFLISFGVSIFLGVRFIRKINCKSKIAHYFVLSLILSVIGGSLSSILKFLDSHFRYSESSLIERFQENLFEVFMYEIQVLGWIITFFIAIIPITTIFLIMTFLINKFSRQIELK